MKLDDRPSRLTMMIRTAYRGLSALRTSGLACTHTVPVVPVRSVFQAGSGVPAWRTARRSLRGPTGVAVLLVLLCCWCCCTAGVAALLSCIPGCTRPIGLPDWLGGSGLAHRAAVSAGSCCRAALRSFTDVSCWSCSSCWSCARPAPVRGPSRLDRASGLARRRGGLYSSCWWCDLAGVSGRASCWSCVVLVVRPSSAPVRVAIPVRLGRLRARRAAWRSLLSCVPSTWSLPHRFGNPAGAPHGGLALPVLPRQSWPSRLARESPAWRAIVAVGAVLLVVSCRLAVLLSCSFGCCIAGRPAGVTGPADLFLSRPPRAFHDRSGFGRARRVGGPADRAGPARVACRGAPYLRSVRVTTMRRATPAPMTDVSWTSRRKFPQPPDVAPPAPGQPRGDGSPAPCRICWDGSDVRTMGRSAA